MGLIGIKASRNSTINCCWSSLKLSCNTNCPWILETVLYRYSAGDVFVSERVYVMSPKRTAGRTVGQSGTSWHMMTDLNVLCHLSLTPVDNGWYVVVHMRRQSVSDNRAVITCDSNSVPWSVVRIRGEPKRVTQFSVNAWVTVKAELSLSEIAKTKQYKRSINVRR